jgi:undecaprenyl-diphosphatase
MVGWSYARYIVRVAEIAQPGGQPRNLSKRTGIDTSISGKRGAELATLGVVPRGNAGSLGRSWSCNARNWCQVQRSFDAAPRQGVRAGYLPSTALYPTVALFVAVTAWLTIWASRIGTIPVDLTFAAWVQSVSVPGVDLLVTALNWLGRPLTLIVLTAGLGLVLLVRRRFAETVLLASTALVNVVNYLLKAAAASPRPTADEVRVIDHATGFGFPSGHTMALTVFCGVIVYLAWRLLDQRAVRFAALAAALVIVLGVGFSRIYSGAHWPTDVLGAYLWSAVYITALVTAYRWMIRRRSHAAPAN